MATSKTLATDIPISLIETGGELAQTFHDVIERPGAVAGCSVRMLV
jgi:hypothetical protein